MTLSLCRGTNDTDPLTPCLSSSQNRVALSIPTIRNNLLLRKYCHWLKPCQKAGQQSQVTSQACATVCSKFISTDMSKSATFQQLNFSNELHELYTMIHYPTECSSPLILSVFACPTDSEFSGISKNPRNLLKIVFSLEEPRAK